MNFSKKLQKEIKEERFWNKVDKTYYCWNWKGATIKQGYGKVSGGKLAHRISWEIFFGEIPIGMFVLHKCDNPLCVNPKHLFIGNQIDNMTDKQQKGRQAKGEHHGRSKLTESDVKNIVYRYEHEKITQKQLAKKFNVHWRSIAGIVKKETWKHLWK